jgi:hypothetical protein
MLFYFFLTDLQQLINLFKKINYFLSLSNMLNVDIDNQKKTNDRNFVYG